MEFPHTQVRERSLVIATDTSVSWGAVAEGVERGTSSVKRRASNVERRASNVEHRASNVERQTSNIERRRRARSVLTYPRRGCRPRRLITTPRRPTSGYGKKVRNGGHSTSFCRCNWMRKQKWTFMENTSSIWPSSAPKVSRICMGVSSILQSCNLQSRMRFSYLTMPRQVIKNRKSRPSAKLVRKPTPHEYEPLFTTNQLASVSIPVFAELRQILNAAKAFDIPKLKTLFDIKTSAVNNVDMSATSRELVEQRMKGMTFIKPMVPGSEREVRAPYCFSASLLCLATNQSFTMPLTDFVQAVLAVCHRRKLRKETKQMESIGTVLPCSQV